MKFYQYLTEGRTTKLDLDEVIERLKSDFSEAYKSYKEGKNYIYRSTGFPGRFGYVDPSKFNRKSANTTNYYTLLMDNLPEWKAFPKRSKSVICSTDNGIYQVFPKNGAKIGICPARDMWWSFDVMLDYLNDLFDIGFFISDKNFNVMKKQMDRISIDKIKEKLEHYHMAGPNFKNKFLKHTINSKNLFDVFRSIISPRVFKIMTIKNNIPVDREVWTDAPCILIKRSELEFMRGNLG